MTVLATTLPLIVSAAPGDELWSDTVNPGGDGGSAVCVVAAKRHFVVGGSVSTAGGSLATVRAYDAKSGDLVWDDDYDAAGLNDSIEHLAAKGKRVVGAGTVREEKVSDGGTQDLFVRAWNAKSGEVLWTDVHDGTGQDYAQGVVAARRWVFAVTELQGTFPDVDSLIRAYDLKTGDVLWDDTYDTPVDASRDIPRAVAATGKHVFVAGTTRESYVPDTIEAFVRAHDAQTGALLWDHTVPDSTTQALVAKGGIVVLGAQRNDAVEGRNWLIRALNKRTGEEIWTDEYDRGARTDAVEAAAVKGRRLVVGGLSQAADGEWDAWLRAYDIRSGDLLWNGEYDPFGDFDEVRDLIIHGRTVLAAVDSRNQTSGEAEITIVAFDLRTGDVLWDSRAGILGDSGDVAHGIAAKGRRTAIVGGRIPVGSFDEDFYVRAVEAR